jgi:zinc protease
MTPDDVREFWQRWYVPANATVVMAGDVEPEQALALARRYYEPIAARPVPPRKPRLEPEQRGLRRLDYKAPAEQAYVALAFKVPQLQSVESPTATDDDVLALTVLAAVLDGYPGAAGARLTQGEGRVADSAGAYNGVMGRGPQMFVLDGVPAAGQSPRRSRPPARPGAPGGRAGRASEAELRRVKAQGGQRGLQARLGVQPGQ